MAKQKDYSLDFSIETSEERISHINEVLESLERRPSNDDLETMANYILYGRDKVEGQNSVQKKLVQIDEKRYNSYSTMADKVLSLESFMENPLFTENEMRPYDDKRIYTKKTQQIRRNRIVDGIEVDPGDGDIPGMRELWAAIDARSRVLDIANGIIEPLAGDEIPHNKYHIYKMKHQLIDMRRHQYYLRDSYKPTIHFLHVQRPEQQFHTWQDTSYWIDKEEWQKKIDALYLNEPPKWEDAEKRTRTTTDGEIIEEGRWIVDQGSFDWESSTHVRALIRFYSKVWMEFWDFPSAMGRSLIFDLDRYTTLANLNEIEERVILRRIDGYNDDQIAADLTEFFHKDISPKQIQAFYTRSIGKINFAAKKHRLLIETPASQKKECRTCGRLLPADPLFFQQDNTKIDGLFTECKECGAPKDARKYAKVKATLEYFDVTWTEKLSRSMAAIREEGVLQLAIENGTTVEEEQKKFENYILEWEKKNPKVLPPIAPSLMEKKQIFNRLHEEARLPRKRAQANVSAAKRKGKDPDPEDLLLLEETTREKLLLKAASEYAKRQNPDPNPPVRTLKRWVNGLEVRLREYDE